MGEFRHQRPLRAAFRPLSAGGPRHAGSYSARSLVAALTLAVTQLVGATVASAEPPTLPAQRASAVRSVTPPPPPEPSRATEAAAQSARVVFPRMVALRHVKTNGRSGPDLDHPVLWTYERQYLPMLAIRGWNGFTLVRDPDGAFTWMLDRLLLSAPHFVVRPASGQTAILRAEPSQKGRPLVQLERSVVGELGACDRGFCAVTIGSRKGYLADADLWGSPEDMAESLRSMRGAGG